MKSGIIETLAMTAVFAAAIAALSGAASPEPERTCASMVAHHMAADTNSLPGSYNGPAPSRRLEE